MRFIPTGIDGPLVIEPSVFSDERGCFFESWNAEKFAKSGIAAAFVQDNHSVSSKGVLRGLHFQQPGQQGKLVRVVRGAVFDVAVDLRKGCATYGQWTGVELSAKNRHMLWVPRGFAHGFLALEDDTHFLYKCDAPYAPAAEHTLAWDDPDVGIDWPMNAGELVISDKDARGRRLADLSPL